MDGVIAFFSDLTTKIEPFWTYQIIVHEMINISAGSSIISLIVFLLGWQILRWLFHKKDRNILTSLIKDDYLRLWVNNLILLTGFILLTLLTLIIMGVSIKVFSNFWRLSLFTVQKNNITVSNVVIGLILLLVTGRFARYLARRFQMVFLASTKLDIGTQKSLETVIRYLLILLSLMFVLTIIGIPLSAFSVVGGAFAIGIGLGSQQLVNNFLSGLVLMAERPLKVGDVVEIEGKMGTVENIGGRSTRIKTYDNVRIVLPNSKLLENSFINWSLGDDQIRREIMVGVAYGSDTALVNKILYQVTIAEPGVMTDPAVQVLFSDFGDNTLNFRILYWVRLSGEYSPLVIASNIRMNIDARFRDAGITIAFPQRDIHIDFSSPMDVHLKKINDS